MAMKQLARRLQPLPLYFILGLTVCLFFLELVIAHVTHSLTLLLDAYHALCNIIVLVGTIISTKVRIVTLILLEWKQVNVCKPPFGFDSVTYLQLLANIVEVFHQQSIFTAFYALQLSTERTPWRSSLVSHLKLWRLIVRWGRGLVTYFSDWKLQIKPIINVQVTPYLGFIYVYIH